MGSARRAQLGRGKGARGVTLEVRQHHFPFAARATELLAADVLTGCCVKIPYLISGSMFLRSLNTSSAPPLTSTTQNANTTTIPHSNSFRSVATPRQGIVFSEPKLDASTREVLKSLPDFMLVFMIVLSHT